jgi:hypothetical protein
MHRMSGDRAFAGLWLVGDETSPPSALLSGKTIPEFPRRARFPSVPLLPGMLLGPAPGATRAVSIGKGHINNNTGSHIT